MRTKTYLNVNFNTCTSKYIQICCSSQIILQDSNHGKGKIQQPRLGMLVKPSNKNIQPSFTNRSYSVRVRALHVPAEYIINRTITTPPLDRYSQGEFAKYKNLLFCTVIKIYLVLNIPAIGLCTFVLTSQTCNVRHD